MKKSIERAAMDIDSVVLVTSVSCADEHVRIPIDTLGIKHGFMAAHPRLRLDSHEGWCAIATGSMCVMWIPTESE